MTPHLPTLVAGGFAAGCKRERRSRPVAGGRA